MNSLFSRTLNRVFDTAVALSTSADVPILKTRRSLRTPSGQNHLQKSLMGGRIAGPFLGGKESVAANSTRRRAEIIVAKGLHKSTDLPFEILEPAPHIPSHERQDYASSGELDVG